MTSKFDSLSVADAATFPTPYGIRARRAGSRSSRSAAGFISAARVIWWQEDWGGAPAVAVPLGRGKCGVVFLYSNAQGVRGKITDQRTADQCTGLTRHGEAYPVLRAVKLIRGYGREYGITKQARNFLSSAAL